MKKNKKEKLYGPNEREFLEGNETPLKSYSEKDYVYIPNNVTDSIVSNNIINPEIDYTEGSILKTKKDEE